MIEVQLTSCPKCGAAVQGRSETCNHCGVIFSKVRADAPSFAPQSMTASQVEVPQQYVASRCQACGSHAPTTHAVFRQNIGAAIMRFSKTVDANLCAPCVRKYFTQFTLVTVAVGWIGVISIVVAPIFVVLNVVNVISASTALARAKSSPGGLPARY